MKAISRKYWFDESYFAGKIPANVDYLPDPSNELPIFMHDEMLTPLRCDDLVNHLLNSANTSTSRASFGVRKTTQFDLTQHAEEIYRQAFLHVKPAIERFFGIQITGSETAHGLSYRAGDRYGMHCDNCDPVLGESSELIEMVCTEPARHISTVLFLSDGVLELTGPNQCIGGNLSFPFLRDQEGEMLLVEPRKGMLLAFPSNPYYAHEVHEIIDGFRMTIVDWHNACRIST